MVKLPVGRLALYERVCEKYGEKPKDIELIFQKAAQAVARQSPQKARFIIRFLQKVKSQSIWIHTHTYIYVRTLLFLQRCVEYNVHMLYRTSTEGINTYRSPSLCSRARKVFCSR